MPGRQQRTWQQTVVTFLRSLLSVSEGYPKNILLRDDYKECAELTLILLGEIPPKCIHWMKPGAFYHER